MKIVLQRVSSASVKVDSKIVGRIEHGLLLLIGFSSTDTEENILPTIEKIVKLRIFSDEEGKMNKSVLDVEGSMLLISQFTLYADTKKGNRPSFIEAARPEQAIPLYEFFIAEMRKRITKVETGIFGADMKVELVNDGPVTIVFD
ncbi:MAG: D-aminoacyl-tRNA deacylase [Flavobacteriales bacterium]|jgi:D-tyrosyl-tRNA(Tyr) deacylase|nr:D-aminoacyl-tRNA deacylase [Flavobacteriales bacterium]MDP4716849.1 D-aminoacyl-tRNA deacylase [Flavobacteriales bacterium]MDP4731084.1 D-aminoacyl-tRNA deacylase [Flavobacteriales bacterium]MDP4818849.1 D-aminoacyl-tRNA deacylase [Flavobacteriales bacterium]MDP4951778.1 D-aminoacyl-tRNA deacylase [Flavobacteriales bacterium]